MKRDLLNRTLFVLIAFFAFSLTTHAQLLMEENFEYEPGGLHNLGGWVRYGAHANNPIQVTEQSLIYPNYVDEATGKAIKLVHDDNTTTTDEDLCKRFNSEVSIKDGAIYVSALIKVLDIEQNESKTKTAEFFALFTTNKPFADGFTGYEYAKLFAKKTGDNKFKLGTYRTTGSEDKIAFTTQEYTLGETLLVIIKYQIIGSNELGEADDEVSLFVNPIIGNTEPAPTVKYELTGGGTGTDVKLSTGYDGFKGVELKQYSNGTTNAPTVLISNIRVARSYAELFKLTPVEPEPTPEITCDPGSYFYFGTWGGVYTGETYTQDIIIKGKNLKGDITIGGMTSGEITASATTIAKADAESENGYTLTLTFKPVKEGEGEDIITFSSEEAKETSISTGWTTTAIKEVADLSTLWQEDFSKFGVYKVTGEVTISHKQVVNNQTYYYLQDGNKGMYILDGFGDIQDADLKAGTKIMNLTGQVQDSWGGYIIPISGIKLYDIVSQDNVITPKIVTLSELETNGAQYKDMLVKVNNVELGWMKEGNFESVVFGDVFTEDAANRTMMKDANEKITPIRMFPEINIIGTPTPATAHITGLSTSAAGNLIAPRSLADIEKLTDPVSIKSNKENALSIYADKGMIHIDGPEIHKAELYDITGNKVAETTAQELRGLVPALYLIKVTTAEGTTVKKLYVK